MRRHTAALAIALCVLLLPTMCMYIEYNTQYTAHGTVTPAISYRVSEGLRLTDGAGELITPLPARTARAMQVLVPAWMRLAASLFDRLLAIAADLWIMIQT